MANYDALAMRLLCTLATLKGLLAEFREELVKLRTVRSACCELEPRLYKDGLILSAWVDAELVDGRAIVWWMDIEPRQGKWHIDRRISESGKDTLSDFPDMGPITLDQMLSTATPALKELLHANDPIVATYLGN